MCLIKVLFIEKQIKKHLFSNAIQFQLISCFKIKRKKNTSTNATSTKSHHQRVAGFCSVVEASPCTRVLCCSSIGMGLFFIFFNY